MAEPYLEFDLTRELEQILAEPEWKAGQNSKTLVKYDMLRVVLVALRAGERIPEHKAAGPISIHTVRGRMRVRAQGRTFDLPPGGLLALDQGAPHEVEGVEDGAFVLTIAWPGRENRSV
jgi:quercetin dioxygenase-like cupin family protein